MRRIRHFRGWIGELLNSRAVWRKRRQLATEQNNEPTVWSTAAVDRDKVQLYLLGTPGSGRPLSAPTRHLRPSSRSSCWAVCVWWAIRTLHCATLDSRGFESWRWGAFESGDFNSRRCQFTLNPTAGVALSARTGTPAAARSLITWTPYADMSTIQFITRG